MPKSKDKLAESGNMVHRWMCTNFFRFKDSDVQIKDVCQSQKTKPLPIYSSSWSITAALRSLSTYIYIYKYTISMSKYGQLQRLLLMSFQGWSMGVTCATEGQSLTQKTAQSVLFKHHFKYNATWSNLKAFWRMTNQSSVKYTRLTSLSSSVWLSDNMATKVKTDKPLVSMQQMS